MHIQHEGPDAIGQLTGETVRLVWEQPALVAVAHGVVGGGIGHLVVTLRSKFLRPSAAPGGLFCTGGVTRVFAANRRRERQEQEDDEETQGPRQPVVNCRFQKHEHSVYTVRTAF